MFTGAFFWFAISVFPSVKMIAKIGCHQICDL